jgi:hypothetical protein
LKKGNFKFANRVNPLIGGIGVQTKSDDWQNYFTIFLLMAIPIQTIPTLEGKQARSFLKLAHKNETERAGSLDFSRQFKVLKKILSKSKIT